MQGSSPANARVSRPRSRHRLGEASIGPSPTSSMSGSGSLARARAWRCSSARYGKGSMRGATNWTVDKAWADEYQPFIEKVMRQHAGAFVAFRPATDEEDCKRATDCVIVFSGGEVAVRFRRPSRDFRDWTVRSRRDTGTETELPEIRRGVARWGLVAWKGNGRPVVRF